MAPLTAPALRPRPPISRGKPSLKVLSRAARQRINRRKARLVTAVAALLLVGSLLLVAAAQAIVASQQVRIDTVTSALQQATTSNAGLELQKAQLESPARVLSLAEKRLEMVQPQSVTYLVPVNPGPSLATITQDKKK